MEEILSVGDMGDITEAEKIPADGAAPELVKSAQEDPALVARKTMFSRGQLDDGINWWGIRG